MSEYLKPLPTPTVESAPFWKALKEHKLVIQRCRNCGKYRHYPRLLCPSCHSSDVEWAPVSGRGNVYTYTVTHRPFHPGFASEVPYATVTIELEQGVRMVSRLTDVKPEEVAIGMPVEVEFVDVTDEVTLPMFHRSKA